MTLKWAKRKTHTHVDGGGAAKLKKQLVPELLTCRAKTHKIRCFRGAAVQMVCNNE